MQPSPRHRAAESQFRGLIGSAALAQPNDVEYTRESIIVRWQGPQVAVIVDLDDAGTDCPLGCAGAANLSL